MVEAMVEVFQTAREEEDFDYFHFFSDSCLPIRACSDLEARLAAQSPKSFIRFPKSPQWVTLHRNFAPYMTKEGWV